MTFSETVMLLITSAPAVIAACIAGTVAIVVVKLTHHYTLKREEEMLEKRSRREKEDAEEKREEEFRFIVVELIFRLEEFAQGCAAVAWDDGIYPGENEAKVPEIPAPVLTLDGIGGEWKSIPSPLLYSIRELPVRERAIRPALSNIYEHLPDTDFWFAERQRRYADAGLRALILTRKLRRLGGYPDSRLIQGTGSPFRIMRYTWRQHLRKGLDGERMYKWTRIRSADQEN